MTVVSGPEIIDKYVGSSEAQLRDLFASPPLVPPRPGDAEDVAQIAENAGGVKDTREKDQWGNPISGMTVIDQAVITSEQKAVLASMSK